MFVSFQAPGKLFWHSERESSSEQLQAQIHHVFIILSIQWTWRTQQKVLIVLLLRFHICSYLQSTCFPAASSLKPRCTKCKQMCSYYWQCLNHSTRHRLTQTHMLHRNSLVMEPEHVYSFFFFCNRFFFKTHVAMSQYEGRKHFCYTFYSQASSDNTFKHTISSTLFMQSSSRS